MADVNELQAIVGLMNQGFTPEQARAQIDEAKAVRFAQMKPEEMVAFNAYRAGQGLGRGLQGLFGVQQEDPMVKMATQLRQLQSQFDTTTAEGMMQYAQALRQVNPQMAQQAALAARKMEQEEARVGLTRAQTSEVTSRAGREATKATKEQEAMKGRAAALRKRFPEMTEEESETLAADPAVVRELIKPVKVDGKTVKTKTVTAGGRVLLINEETGETIKDIGPAGKSLEESLGTGLGLLGRSLGFDKPKDIAGFRNQVLEAVKTQRSGYEAADQAVTLADDAIRTGNFASAEGLASKLAKASGDTQLSNRDVQKYRTDPSFVGSVSDVTKRLLTGTPTADTLRKLREYARVLKTKQEESIKRELDTQRGLAKRSGFKDEDIDAAFGGIIGTPTGGNVKRTKSGVTYTVED